MLVGGTETDTDAEDGSTSDARPTDDGESTDVGSSDTACMLGSPECPCPAGQIFDGVGCIVPSADELRATVPVLQDALAGDTVFQAPTVQLLLGGQPVAGVPIAFAVSGDPGGIVGAAQANTDANGSASAASWELGKLDGEYLVTASVPSLPAVEPVQFVARTLSDFEIVLHYVNPVTPSQETAFELARRRWQGALINSNPALNGDLSDFAAMCGFSGTGQGPVSITGAHIFVELAEIDGPGGPNGNVLGQAGPCFLRDNGSPALGGMTFDTFDLEELETEGSLETVILHEMGHVLGVGTLWRERGLLLNPSSPGNPGADTHFTGTATQTEFTNLLMGASFEGSIVPVENDASPGSADGHWRENVFDNELMSPRLGGFGQETPLSLLTIVSLGDHGYYVPNVLAADPYALPFFLVGPGPDDEQRPRVDHPVAPRWRALGSEVRGPADAERLR